MIYHYHRQLAANFVIYLCVRVYGKDQARRHFSLCVCNIHVHQPNVTPGVGTGKQIYSSRAQEAEREVRLKPKN